MESPSPTVRRRAWINSSRQRGHLEGPESDGVPASFTSASLADDDDVFSDGDAQTLIVAVLGQRISK